MDRFQCETIDGRQIQFLRRTPRMRERLRASAKAWHKQHLADSLRLAGIDGDAMLPRLEAFDRQRLDAEGLVRYLNEDTGQLEALELALAEQPEAQAEEIIESLSDRGLMLEIVARLWDLQLVAPAATAETGDEGPDPNPPAPLTFQTPAAAT